MKKTGNPAKFNVIWKSKLKYFTFILTDWGAGQSCLCNAWPGMKQNHQICSIMLRTIVTVVDHTGSVGVWIEIDTA